MISHFQLIITFSLQYSNYLINNSHDYQLVLVVLTFSPIPEEDYQEHLLKIKLNYFAQL